MDHIKTPKIENVRMVDRYNNKFSSVGILYLTATHLIYVDPEINKETWILHMQIGSVEKLSLTTTGSPLLIRCKTFLTVIFIIPKERDCIQVYNSLIKLCQPASYENLYCFQYLSRSDQQEKRIGWDYFKIEDEFERMKVPNKLWVLTNLNKDYKICETYPSNLYVPASASTAMLIGSSRFRSKGRLPVLTYLHENQSCIVRCSQPLSGFNARCLEDEQLLEAIRKTNPNSNHMYVVDTRPRINAMANRAAGKGYENEAFYENTKFHFIGIDNIHVMRASLQKLVEICEQETPTMNSFLSALGSSEWLRHIRAVLETSKFIADAVARGISVICHCSDGWDRTSQVCGLASIMLDPYYRTIKGFQALIQKDWLSFGHKFSERCGHIQTDAKEVSPVFTQFLECTWQMMHQRFDEFEFNEKFLLDLHDHVYSCQYGTFVGNCERDRVNLKLQESTYSLWTSIQNKLNEYQNPFYRSDNNNKIFLPDLAPQNLQYWRGMYNRYEEVHPREMVEEVLNKIQNHCTSLEDHLHQLQREILDLKQKASQSNNEPTSPASTKIQAMNADDKNDNTLSKYTIAVDWKSLRQTSTCVCSAPFDHSYKKAHCWHCGEVYCNRCVDKSMPLLDHASGKSVPVCRLCYNLKNGTDSDSKITE